MFGFGFFGLGLFFNMKAFNHVLDLAYVTRFQQKRNRKF